MAVIVKDMDMPESCKRCPIRYDCYRWVRFLQTQTTTACHPKMEGCQIKSVEGLIEKIERIGGDEEKSVYKNLNPSYVQGLKDAVKCIKEYCGLEESNGET